MERYSRQINLAELGEEGQKKLQNSKVLIIGAGGLGSPAALYLAAAGVGTIGIVDGDTIALHNLNRQILHTVERVNMSKCESAGIAIRQFNPDINVITYNKYVDENSIGDLISEYDFVIDAVDRIEAKYLINDACVKAKKPYCHAGVIRFEGQVMTYIPGEGPCYRCVFEEIPECGVPTCAEVGVLGAVVGVIGSVEALEAIKYIIGKGELLTGKMFIFDGLNMKTRVAKLPPVNCKCKVCSKQ